MLLLLKCFLYSSYPLSTASVSSQIFSLSLSILKVYSLFRVKIAGEEKGRDVREDIWMTVNNENRMAVQRAKFVSYCFAETTLIEDLILNF